MKSGYFVIEFERPCPNNLSIFSYWDKEIVVIRNENALYIIKKFNGKAT